LELDDQIVPIDASAHASSKLIKNATLKVYPGVPHGLPWTHRDEFNNNLLAFLKACGRLDASDGPNSGACKT
jgi:non-heme chloroperoxidase